MTQFPQRLGFDLADAFAGNRKRLSDLFEGVLGAVFESEAHLDYLLLARSQRAQHVRRLLLEVYVDHGFCRRNNAAIFDEVAKMRVFFLADWGLKRDRLLC